MKSTKFLSSERRSGVLLKRGRGPCRLQKTASLATMDMSYATRPVIPVGGVPKAELAVVIFSKHPYAMVVSENSCVMVSTCDLHLMKITLPI